MGTLYLDDICRYDWPAARKRIKRRMRRPTLRGVLRQAATAGVSVASITVDKNGAITITPGTSGEITRRVTDEINSHPIDASEWN